jgi:hypothetical protein
MSSPDLSHGARSALWIGGGAFVGLAVGALVVDPGRALSYSPLWLLLVTAYVGGILFSQRKRGVVAPGGPTYAYVPTTAAPRPAPVPTATGPLQLRFTLLDVPGGFPPVMGEGEPVHVRVRATRRDAPAEGAAVRLTAALRDGARFLAGEGVTGSDGSVEMTVRPPGRGELLLEAEGKLDDVTGTATTSLSVVRYEEEIDRLFSEFRAYSVSLLGADAHADTARELAERLRRGAAAETSRALLELARIYELVAYGERDADRRLYLALMNELLVLEEADLPGSPAPPAAPVGG